MKAGKWLRQAVAIIALLGLVPLTGYVVVRTHGPQVEREAFSSLEVIAGLKSAQLENWLSERYNDSAAFMSSELLNSQLLALRKKNEKSLQDALRNTLAASVDQRLYESVMVLDPEGRSLLPLGKLSLVEAEIVSILPAAFASGRTQFSEFIADEDGGLRLGFVVPLFHLEHGERKALGAVVLHVRPEASLFPYIQSWPSDSPSGEIQLLRRDGDALLYLNPQRQHSGEGMTLRLPLSDQELTAVAAIKAGRPGTVLGHDYRGAPVYAAYRPIAGTGWVLLAKLDRDEVRAPLHDLARWIGLIAFLAIASLIVVMLLLWRQRGRAMQLERQTQADHLLRQFYELPFIGIAISSPLTKRWLNCNERLCEILGYAREELIGMSWQEMTHADDLPGNLAQFEQLKRGETDGYLLDKRFIRKDGSTVFVTLDVKCVRRADATPEFILSTVQDISERKRAEAKIGRLTHIYAALSECNQAIVRCQDQEALFPLICRAAVQYGGMKLARISLLDRDSGWLRTVACFGEQLAQLSEVPVTTDASSPLGRGSSGTAVREGRPVWVQDFINDPSTQPWHERGILEGWRASAALPLSCRGVVIGALRLYAGEPHAFDEEIRRLLVEMASDISFALTNFANEADRRLMESELRESERRFRDLYENAPLAYQSLDIEGNILEVNASWLALLGRTRDEVIGRFIGDFMTEISITTLQNEFPEFQQTGRVDGPQYVFVHRDGTVRQVRVNGQISRDRAGNFLRTHCILTDLTERLQSEEQLKLAAKVFEQSAEGVIITDAEHRILMVNRAFTSITGYSAAEALGLTPRLMASGRHDRQFFQNLWAVVHELGYWQGEMWNRRKDGDLYPELVSISQVLDAEGKVSHYVGIFSDISEHKASQERIQKLAYFDALTGLPNRSLLADRVSQALSRMERNNEALALIFLDLDRFKNVNDSLGHRIGDELLIQVAGRLKATLREEDTVSRLGGDEFILVLPRTSAEGATHVVEKILAVLARPYHIELHELSITPSLGIAMYPGDGDSYETLSMCADAAMYRAKQGGRNTFRFFTREMQERSERTLHLENALRRVLDNQQLQLHYQPQIALDSKQIIGAEALLRWQHPELGMISPADFIPVAEDSGLILPIGEWVLREAVRQMKTWMEAGMAPMVMAVNLSAIQFRQANLPELVSGVLAEFDLQPECLELELTEGVAMEDPLAAIEMMNVLHARGIRLSIDDFGTGYSSLSYLKRFKVYKLKIDQSFVRDISCDPDDEAIVDAIIGLSKSLGLQTIAEGVETAEQLDFLRRKGCAEGQGYLFGRPMPAAAFAAFVRDYRPS
jgi:diguanylate cyclase (GGDEF)-like protein/PAS domain S-box-containing protein